MKLGDLIQLEKNNLINIEDDGTYIIAGVQNYGQGIVNRRNVTGAELTMRQYQKIRPNQLMWCKVDTKNGAFGVTQKEHEGSLASTNMALANILLDKANPDFIQLLFQIPFFYEYMNGLSTGTTNRKYLKVSEVLTKIEIPDMNLEQQDRFMNYFDTFKKQHDKLLYEESVQIELIQHLCLSILQEAVQGKLVPQDESDEPASVLLEKIRVEKERLIKDNKIKKEQPLPEISEEEMPYELPRGWEWARLGDIIKDKPRNGYSPKSVDYPTAVKSLTLTATTSGRFRPECYKFIDESIPSESFLWLEKGDILIQRSNSLEYVGTSCIFTGEPNTFIYPDLMMKIQVVNYVELFYLQLALSSRNTREYFQKCASGTSSSMPKINQSIVMNTIIALPPLNEQKRIVNKVNQLMALCDELEKTVEQSKQESKMLMQSVLQEAFQSA